MIKFYSSRDPFGVFSNFLRRYPITIDGIVWNSSEHYYQSRKFDDPELQEKVRAAATPAESAAIGRDRSLPLRPDWEQIRDKVMFRAVMAKFNQYTDLADVLLATGNETLIEHTENDNYWADNGDGTGKNMLGSILMEVRTMLRRY